MGERISAAKSAESLSAWEIRVLMGFSGADLTATDLVLADVLPGGNETFLAVLCP